ncbi:MAG TPA: serine hydrolase domain-containing protein [Candidatus Limnocylindria bacterium]|nr:serine hydrolase domain-containing protein [Candidatus Limnocylindria bacterium]
MKQFICVTVFLLHLASSSARADKVGEFVTAEMEKHQIPGLALTIIRAGEETRTAFYGLANVELKAPARPETVFEIASLTKQFTAACILLLEQDGKLSVDDKISKHLADIPAGWSNITIRHLLTHTSGIRNYTGLDGFELAKHLSQAQFIQALGVQPPDFAPGENYKYCNSGYNLLGFIIENVSGKNYWSFLAERIWAPLSMTASTNRDPGIIVPQRADGYIRKNGALRNRDNDLTDVFAAGAIVSTLGDLVKWNAALDTDKLLNATSRARMWTAGKLNDGSETPYGFGWRVNPYQGHKNIGHSGSTSGFSVSLQRFPSDKLVVIVLCNSDEPNIATTLAKTIASFYFTEKQPTSGR